MNLFVVITSVLFFASFSSFPFSDAKNLETVSELNLTSYMGHWYQVYAAPFDFTFQGYGKCITAAYHIISDNNVSVLNSQLNVNNVFEDVDGYAFYKDISKPGQLSVVLSGVPTVAPYWVIKLGNIDDDGLYPYSIVSVPQGPSLWVLARNISEFLYEYDYEVTDFLNLYEFTYIPVVQDCDF